MAPTPYLVACLVQLRAEFNAVSPKRDKGADGWIGDAAHRGEVSDHNPDSAGRVLAVDIDSTGPWPQAFDTYVQSIVARQKAGWDGRLEYVIWNRHIASRSSRWAWLTYTGTNDPHTGHAHFSARHDHTGNTDKSPWGVEDEVTPDDIGRIASAVWAAGFGTGATRETSGQRLGHVDAVVDELSAKVDALETKVDAILAKLGTIPTATES
jgi:hypothetical protein